MKTIKDLQDLVKRYDYPGKILLTKTEYDECLSVANSCREKGRNTDGSRYFWFGETCIVSEPPNDRVVDLVNQQVPADEPIEIPCVTPEAEWHGHESPLVQPPVPPVRKGSRRKHADKLARSVVEDIEGKNYE